MLCSVLILYAKWYTDILNGMPYCSKTRHDNCRIWSRVGLFQIQQNGLINTGHLAFFPCQNSYEAGPGTHFVEASVYAERR